MPSGVGIFFSPRYFNGLSTSFSFCLPSPEMAVTVNVFTSPDSAGNVNHARSEARS